MKKFYLKHRKSILWQAVQSGAVLSLFVFAGLRMFFYEYSFSWTAEALFFLKAYCCSCFLFASATGGIAWLYRSLLRMKRQSRGI